MHYLENQSVVKGLNSLVQGLRAGTQDTFALTQPKKCAPSHVDVTAQITLPLFDGYFLSL